VFFKFTPIIFGTKYVVWLPDIIASTINFDVADDSVANNRLTSTVSENDCEVDSL
jgi:hypothetical protein